MSFECYECGRLFVSAASRGSHKKWCASHVEVEIEEVIMKFSMDDSNESCSDNGSDTYSFPIPDDNYDGFVEYELSEEDENDNVNYFFDINFDTNDYENQSNYIGVIDDYN